MTMMRLTQTERIGPNLRFHCAHHCPPGRLRDINKVNLLCRRPLFIPKFNEAQNLRFNSDGFSFSCTTELEVQHKRLLPATKKLLSPSAATSKTKERRTSPCWAEEAIGPHLGKQGTDTSSHMSKNILILIN